MNQPGKALVVDDNHLNRRLAQALLQRLGWLVDEASDGLQALAALQADHYDLVLLDLRMPHLSGEEVCQAIRDDLKLHHLPVVAYTAHRMLEERGRILARGFDDLLIKPVTLADVRTVCERSMSARRSP